MSIRQVKKIIKPVYVTEGAGVHLRRTIASRTLNYLDPFLLFDHFGSDDPKDYLAGFPMHPHRGIETVTYMLSGNVNHKDSLGNAGTIGSFDVQWMTSGSGILHEEMPQEPEEGKLEGFQLWVNLPAKLKMTTPRYQEVKASQIPEISLNNGTLVKIIAGQLNGVNGPVKDIYANPEYLDVSIPKNSLFEHVVPEDHTVFAYVFEGICDFDDENTVPATNLIIFGKGNKIKVKTFENSARFLLISGKPLKEPIARYGPFVMNTPDEIKEALRDLREGTFVK